MNKKIIMAIALLLGGLTPLTVVANNLEQSSNRDVVIDEDYLMLRDIFPNIDDKSIVVRPAPAPGKSYYLNRNDLQEIVNKHHVDSYDDEQLKGIYVTRAGRNIDRQEIETLVRGRVMKAETKQYDDIDIKVRLSKQEITLPKQGDIKYNIENFSYADTTGNFQGEIIVSVNGKAYNNGLKFSGVVVLKKKLPTLMNSVQRGTIIGERDVIHRFENIKNLHDGIITIAGDIIGMETKRHIRANSNLQFRDFQMPLLVKKKQQVNMVLATKTIKITATGIALQDGAMGDIISIKNVTSGIVVEGKVVSAETVQISISTNKPTIANSLTKTNQSKAIN
ncbi:MAG: flagellar basal body P-ring formation chaperone FlgA [Alphaproteobacteria bacterium]|nr:flagellar basal body P-ring formation chaperone FlgA [Alphaproteobacteria bacterium]